MSQLAQTLQRSLSMPVWDRTGVSGNYRFEFRYARDTVDDADVNAPALTTALQDLGLKLEKRRGPIETLEIDSFEAPSEN